MDALPLPRLHEVSGRSRRLCRGSFAGHGRTAALCIAFTGWVGAQPVLAQSGRPAVKINYTMKQAETSNRVATPDPAQTEAPLRWSMAIGKPTPPVSSKPEIRSVEPPVIAMTTRPTFPLTTPTLSMSPAAKSTEQTESPQTITSQQITSQPASPQTSPLAKTINAMTPVKMTSMRIAPLHATSESATPVATSPVATSPRATPAATTPLAATPPVAMPPVAMPQVAMTQVATTQVATTQVATTQVARTPLATPPTASNSVATTPFAMTPVAMTPVNPSPAATLTTPIRFTEAPATPAPLAEVQPTPTSKFRMVSAPLMSIPRRQEPSLPQTPSPDVDVPSPNEGRKAPSIERQEENKAKTQEKVPSPQRNVASYLPTQKPITDLDINIVAKSKSGTNELPDNLASSVQGDVPVLTGARAAEMEQQVAGVSGMTADRVGYQPLYFEEVNLERYGYSPYRLGPAASVVRFYATIPALPYAMTVHPPRQAQYWNWPYPAGWGAPRVRELPPLQCKGGLVQAGAITGAAFLVP